MGKAVQLTPQEEREREKTRFRIGRELEDFLWHGGLAATESLHLDEHPHSQPRGLVCKGCVLEFIRQREGSR